MFESSSGEASGVKQLLNKVVAGANPSEREQLKEKEGFDPVCNLRHTFLNRLFNKFV